MQIDPDANFFDLAAEYLGRLFDIQGQAEFALIGLFIFILFIFRVRKDEYLWEQIKNWARVSIGIGFVMAILLWISPIVAPETDPFMLYRTLVLRGGSFMLGLILLTGGTLTVGVIFPKGMAKKIEEAKYGPTIIYSVIIGSLAYIVTYS